MKKILVMMIVVWFAMTANAQVKRGEWLAGPVITTTNPVYSGGAAFLEEIITGLACGVNYENGTATRELPASSQLWMPNFTYKWHAIKNLELDGDKAKFRHKMDWKLKNYSVGYRLGYMSRTAPFGFELQANYEQENMAYKLANDEDYRDATKTMFVPVALIKVRFGSYTKGAFNPTLEIGGSYDYTLSFKEKIGDVTFKGKDFVNNGFSGIVGLGFTIPATHLSWAVRYLHKFYKYYNEDAELNGKKLELNEKSTFGTFMVVSSYAF